MAQQPFYSFGGFQLNPNGPTAFLVASLGAFLGPGPMPGSVGISLTGLPVGTTNYKASDYFQQGRCAVLAQQLLRIRDGATPPAAYLFCTAYPGSTWHSGGGGGLAPGSAFTGSISGLTLTVESLTSGFVAGGQPIVAAGVNPMVRVYANLTLARDAELPEHLAYDNVENLTAQQLTPGGVGTYQTALTFTSISAPFSGTGPAASFTATANNGVMAVSAIASGSLAVNQVIAGGTLPVRSIIQQQIDGTPGGVGTYLLGLPQTVASEAMVGKGVSWTNMVAILNAIPPGKGAFPTVSYSNALISSVGYTQGGSADGTRAGKEADLTDMLVQFDALGLNLTPIKLYLALPSVVSNSTIFTDTVDGTQSFARTNALRQGQILIRAGAYASGPKLRLQVQRRRQHPHGRLRHDALGRGRGLCALVRAGQGHPLDAAVAAADGRRDHRVRPDRDGPIRAPQRAGLRRCCHVLAEQCRRRHQGLAAKGLSRLAIRCGTDGIAGNQRHECAVDDHPDHQCGRRSGSQLRLVWTGWS